MAVADSKPAAVSELVKRNVHYVKQNNGNGNGDDAIAEYHVTLNATEVPELQLTVDRTSTSLVYARESYVTSDFAENPRVVCFLHGFSQRPSNYEDLLLALASAGYVVVAPRVWLFETAFASVPGAKVPGTSGRASQPAKLQTALLTDAIRSVAWARSKGMTSVSLVGHSMGGAMALVAARAVGAESVATLGPAVGPTSKTGVNEYLSLDDGGDIAKFASNYPNTPTLIVTGLKDLIAPSGDCRKLYQAFDDADNPKIVGLVSIDNGTHLGFQDTLKIDVPVLRLLDRLFSKILELFVYGFGELFSDPGKQMQFSIELVLKWLNATYENKHLTVEQLRKICDAVDEDFNIAEFEWGVTDVPPPLNEDESGNAE